MALFGLFKSQPPPPPPPAPQPASMQVAPVPAQLPKITAPTAAEIAKTSEPGPAAQKLLTLQQTPSEYLNALQKNQMGDEMVKTMAHGMPDQEGVLWAAKSAETVSDKLPAGDVEAMKAAQSWAKSPTDVNKSAAAAAAANSGYKGPGALAAQGAAWSQPAAGVPRLTPHAVAGAVLMSAAIKANPSVALPAAQLPGAPQTPQVAGLPQAPAVVPPEVQAQTFKQQHPFIALGIEIASGKTVA
jgi:hypothetical protein